MPSPGEILGGRYRLDERIAAGGMGEVWRATDTVLGRDVAVKTLHADRAGDPGFQERFRHEARSMAALHHPGVADVYDFGETEGGTDAYIVMARIDGEPLSERIAGQGRLTAAETMSVVAQSARALEAAHQAGIVHRDVKPSNLIIKPDGTVVLVDFGVARSAGSSTLTGAKEVVGTAMYIAPEQVSKEPTGPPADLYALGVVAYHCLAGHPPFMGDNPIGIAMQHLSETAPDLPDDVPPAVRAVVTRAMEKNPADRFATAAAMAEAADRAVSGGDTTAILAAPRYAAAPGAAAAPPTLTEPAGPGGRRRLPVVLGAAGVLVLAGAVVALAMWLPDNDNDKPGVTSPSQSVQGSAGSGNAPASNRTSTRTRPPATTGTTTRPTAPSSAPSVSEEPSDPPSNSQPATSTPPDDPPASEDTGTDTGDGGDDTQAETESGSGTGSNSGPGSGSGG